MLPLFQFDDLQDRFTSGEKPGSSRGAAAASSMAPGEEAEGTGRIGVKNRSAPRSPKIGPPTSSGRVPRNFYPLVKTTSAVSPTSSARVPKNFPPGVKTTGEVRTGVQERTMVCTSEWYFARGLRCRLLCWGKGLLLAVYLHTFSYRAVQILLLLILLSTRGCYIKELGINYHCCNTVIKLLSLPLDTY